MAAGLRPALNCSRTATKWLGLGLWRVLCVGTIWTQANNNDGGIGGQVFAGGLRAEFRFVLKSYIKPSCSCLSLWCFRGHEAQFVLFCDYITLHTEALHSQSMWISLIACSFTADSEVSSVVSNTVNQGMCFVCECSLCPVLAQIWTIWTAMREHTLLSNSFSCCSNQI